MTAGILWLGLRLLGAEKVALFDEVRQDQWCTFKPICIFELSIFLTECAR